MTPDVGEKEFKVRIAAIVPCYNEEAAVGTVVTDLKNAVPGIEVYVYDNNSTDRTAEVAQAAGAIVRKETRKGKGNVVRRAFADIDADVYVMIDGDDTYDASAAPEMIDLLVRENLDHVLGCRVDDKDNSAYRPGHAQGNKMFNSLVGFLFGDTVTDMLSGYRVFSRRFVKSFPALSREFEIETELTVHSMALRVPQAEYGVGFKDRPSSGRVRRWLQGSPRRLRIQAAYLPRWLPYSRADRPLGCARAPHGLLRNLLCNLHAPGPVLRSPCHLAFHPGGQCSQAAQRCTGILAGDCRRLVLRCRIAPIR